MNAVAVICLSPYRGGMELDSLKIANFLADDNKVSFICKRKTFLDHISAEKLDSSSAKFTIDFKSKLSLKLSFQLRRILQENKVENLIFFGASELGAIFIATLNIPINIIIQHGTSKWKKKNSLYHKLIYRKVNHHVAVSNHIARNVSKIIPTGNADIHVIYTAVDLKKPENNRSGQTLKLIHVGRIDRKKGQIDAVEACQVLFDKNIDFELVIVGGSDFSKELERLKSAVNNKPYKDQITLVGYTQDVIRYYACADILLFPSHGEGMSNVILEALGYQLQCVCYDNTSFGELRALGLHLYLAKDQDPEDLKMVLLQAVEELNRSQPLRGKNKKIIEENFSVDSTKEKFNQLLV